MKMRKVILTIPTDTRTLLRRLREHSRYDIPHRNVTGWEYWMTGIERCNGYEEDTWMIEVIGFPSDEDEAEWKADYPVCARLRASPLGDGRTKLVVEATDDLWPWAQDLIDQVRDWWPNLASGGKTGRPKLSDDELKERAKTVEEVLQKKKELNITLEQACARVGMSYSTFKFWRRRIGKAKKG